MDLIPLLVSIGGYFSSPFQYNALLTCSPAPGTYTVHMYDNYGDGWQTGATIQGLSVDIDGTIVMLQCVHSGELLPSTVLQQTMAICCCYC